MVYLLEILCCFKLYSLAVDFDKGVNWLRQFENT